MKHAGRMAAIATYAFAELDELCEQRRAAGADVIDFGVGDPTDPTPGNVLEAAAAGLVRHRAAGYPSYVGSPEFREAVAAWFGRRHGVALEARTQVSITVGSQGAVFHAPLAFVDPGDVVLLPSPGYPPYVRGTHFAGGRWETYPVLPEGPLLPDLDALPDELSAHLAMVWITQPHVPTGRVASLAALQRLADQCRARGVLLCSDEAYSELWTETPAPSALETGSDHVLVFQSLSKRSEMTGYRVGFVAGDAEAVGGFRRLKTNIDSGVPRFVEDAGIAALQDESAPRRARERYAARTEVMVAALRRLGCDVAWPEAGFYLWCSTPDGGSGVEFARRLLAEAPALAVMPGEWLADPVGALAAGHPAAARTPGAGRVRWALVPDLERCREAADRLASWA